MDSLLIKNTIDGFPSHIIDATIELGATNITYAALMASVFNRYELLIHFIENYFENICWFTIYYAAYRDKNKDTISILNEYGINYSKLVPHIS